MTMGSCRLLDSTNNWPSFFKCDDTARFPPMCKVSICWKLFQQEILLGKRKYIMNY